MSISRETLPLPQPQARVIPPLERLAVPSKTATKPTVATKPAAATNPTVATKPAAATNPTTAEPTTEPATADPTAEPAESTNPTTAEPAAAKPVYKPPENREFLKVFDNTYSAIAMFVIILNVLIITIYCIVILYYIITLSSPGRPLYIESLDYAILYNLAFFPGNNNFNYTYIFMILYFISCIIFALSIWVFNTNTDVSSVKVILISCFVAMCSQVVISVILSTEMVAVKERVNIANTYICQNIYKRDLVFLSKIQKPAKSIVETHNRIYECLKILEKETKPRELAQGLYTLTLYKYYQDSYINNNDKLVPAFKIFDSKDILLSYRGCNPISYMSRYGTFIDDITETIIRPHMKKSENLEEAFSICDAWVSQTNEYANTIYPDFAFYSFAILILSTAIIMVLLIAFLFKFFYLYDFMNKYFSFHKVI